MNCPLCGGKSRVYDTVHVPSIVWRRRRCLRCGHQWMTSEVEDEILPGQVVKRPAPEQQRQREICDG